jgi:hypothetical protein
MDRTPDTVQFLVSLKYPENAALTKGDSERYALELYQMPPDEFDVLFKAEERRFRQLSEERERLEEPDRSYNQKNAFANTNEWGRVGHWTLEESISLTFGRDPRVVNWHSLQAERSTRFFDRFAELRAKVQDAATRHLLFDPTVPGLYLSWAAENGIHVDEKLIDTVRAYGNDGTDWKTSYENLRARYQYQNACLTRLQATVDSREGGANAIGEGVFGAIGPSSMLVPHELAIRGVDDLFKLIAAMARSRYASATNSYECASEIERDLNSQGLSMDTEIIRHWLLVAHAVLP